MRRDMAAGITLVVDRYVYSGMVYSAAKGLGDLSLGWARAPDVGLPRPDLCVFLDIEPEAAARRGGFGGEKYEEGGMQRRVRALFGEVWRREGEAVRVLDAGKEVEAVEMEIRALVEALLREGIDEGLRTIEPWGSQETG